MQLTEMLTWIQEAALALDSASTIAEREGCKLHLANHDRLLKKVIDAGWLDIGLPNGHVIKPTYRSLERQ